eukprot:CAMPEP_0197026490 /NCGR_PEP_ID=MMETSP1384-20130603/6562_1 /TAXON_ID=29189 /ORGANISM="Ammonia sp." /LENGTH=417 /DNA_ID=CAMNT_0042455163 /DNA_START=207 /DNA_END=1457 /DNA_ORIENTATION=+
MAQTKDTKISEVTVGQAAGGMRGVKALICETSELDINEGIRFRGLTLPECEQKLPTGKVRGANKSEYTLPEAMLWLLLTGEIPTEAEARQLSEELTSEPYNVVPKHARRIVDELPVHQHPMSQFITGVMALQTESKFAHAYQEGVNRAKYWKYALDDALNLIAKIPHVSARIYRQTFRDGNVFVANEQLDWSANWANMVGLTKDGNDEISDLMRMYFTIHTDHEGGNVSAHATHLVGSALSDPYLSYAAGMCGLAGPLHGLANQESLRFVRRIQRLLGDQKPDEEFIHKFVVDLLESGQVVPGFGHAVLRVTDPRYTIQREFALKYLADSHLFKIVDLLYQVAPPILKEWKGGKIANPWPNLDAHSGCLLYEYGLKEDSFYTVLFGMSRAIGVLSNYVIDRALSAPIERPKSVTFEW